MPDTDLPRARTVAEHSGTAWGRLRIPDVRKRARVSECQAWGVDLPQQKASPADSPTTAAEEGDEALYLAKACVANQVVYLPLQAPARSALES